MKIDSIQDFQSILTRKTSCYVIWEVKPDLGPGNIGSSREIVFYINDTPISDTRFHHQLKKSLIEAINIPESSRNRIINGEGDITLENSKIFIDYSWTSSRPYSDGYQSGRGIELLNLND